MTDLDNRSGVTNSPRLRQDLERVFGNRYTADDEHGTSGAVWPENATEVQQLARLTQAARVPLIPLGSRTNAFAGRPSEHSLRVFFDNLSSIRGVNARTHLVWVEPGVLWRDLSEYLAPHVLMPRIYPSSEGFSTVGGFVAQGGLGIGSYQFGSIERNLQAVRVVTGSGELRRLKGNDLRLVVGAEGRTGIIVEVVLRVQDRTALQALVMLLESMADVERVAATWRRNLPLWSVKVMDPAGVQLASRNWPQRSLPQKYAVLFTFRRADAASITAELQATARARGAEVIEVVDDVADWLLQFSSLEALDTTPTPLKYRFPPGKGAEFLESVPQRTRARLAMQILVADKGATIEMAFYFIEQVGSEVNHEVARELLDLAKRFGGTAYSTGSVYLNEAANVFGEDRVRELVAFQDEVDPDRRLNPGRAFQ